MTTLVWDLETNGLLRELTEIHCIVTEDVDTGEINAYYESEEQKYEGLLALYNAECIVGHNIIGYDIPAIRKFYPKWTYKSCYDTFLLSCLFEPDRPHHTIESYSGGTKIQNSDWSCLTYNILDRCVSDVKINTQIWRDMEARAHSDMWKKAIELEQRVATNHTKQIDAGVDFDYDRAMATIGCLDAELGGLRECIEGMMGYRCIPGGQYKKIFKKDGTLPAYVTNYFGGVEVKSIHED